MSSMTIGIMIALALAAALLVPYLFKEIRKGKVSLGPRLPDGASEPHPGGAAIRRRGTPMRNPIRTIRAPAVRISDGRFQISDRI
jgi:hypothetical protein